MNFDQMLETWRTQDKAPLYGVRRELLRLGVPGEQADLDRALGRDLWGVYWGTLGTSVAWLAVVFGLLFAAISWGDVIPSAWDYVALGIGIGTILLSAGAYRASRKRQALYARGFGNSIQEEIRRNLARVDYQLSRYGRLTSLLMYAPMAVAGILTFWVIVRLSGKPFDWLHAAASLLFIVPGWVVWSLWFKKHLLAYRRRFSELLGLLNPGN
ncbi:hypothetical protein [Steroidobacter agaridevorans]|uniref:hypothetical protein n=1 Tax=Steroidobacter agaridevorans TaxID=2695856 RepID=UPI00132464FC|nr:hypothetical protein [Steroidobacter agaridevorans]GFE86916.1 hypothetical protein GCM10011488_18700 [Steroidobacter agaridevorans]